MTLYIEVAMGYLPAAISFLVIKAGAIFHELFFMQEGQMQGRILVNHSSCALGQGGQS
jgi:hypothetical protein